MWIEREELDDYIQTHRQEISEEAADILFSLLMFSHDAGINLEEVFLKKLDDNKKKYPVEKSKGKRVKYTEL